MGFLGSYLCDYMRMGAGWSKEKRVKRRVWVGSFRKRLGVKGADGFDVAHHRLPPRWWVLGPGFSIRRPVRLYPVGACGDWNDWRVLNLRTDIEPVPASGVVTGFWIQSYLSYASRGPNLATHFQIGCTFAGMALERGGDEMGATRFGRRYAPEPRGPSCPVPPAGRGGS